jgi:hypothetical protein
MTGTTDASNPKDLTPGITVSGTSPFACVLGTNSATVAQWVCTGNLAPGDTSIFDVFIDGINALTNNTVTWTILTACNGSPTPCTNGVVSAANSDGGGISGSGATDNIRASDLDALPAVLSGVANVATPQNVLWTYQINNDGRAAVGDVVFSGTIASSAGVTRNNVDFVLQGNEAANWTCLTNAPTFDTFTCNGPLTDDNSPYDDTQVFGISPGQIVITVRVNATFPAAGDTVTVDPGLPTCTNPTGACATVANADGAAAPAANGTASFPDYPAAVQTR